MGLKKFCKDIAYDVVAKSNENNPLVAQACKDGTIYIGRSMDVNIPEKIPRYGWRSWKLTSKFGLYVMPHDLSREDRQKHHVEFYVDGVGTHVYPDLEAHGHKDWRQPTMDELYHLFHLRNKGALRGTFNTVRDKYSEPWTKTSYMSSNEGFPSADEYQYKWVRDFSSGEAGKCLTNNIKNVNIRLIRIGPILSP